MPITSATSEINGFCFACSFLHDFNFLRTFCYVGETVMLPDSKLNPRKVSHFVGIITDFKGCK